MAEIAVMTPAIPGLQVRHRDETGEKGMQLLGRRVGDWP